MYQFFAFGFSYHVFLGGGDLFHLLTFRKNTEGSGVILTTEALEL